MPHGIARSVLSAARGAAAAHRRTPDGARTAAGTFGHVDELWLGAGRTAGLVWPAGQPTAGLEPPAAAAGLGCPAHPPHRQPL